MKAQYLKDTPVLPMPEYFGDGVRDWPIYVERSGRGILNYPTRYVIAPKGTFTTHPDCWRLVRMGVCAPADEECQKAAGMTDSKIADQKAKHDLLEQGKLYVPDPK